VLICWVYLSGRRVLLLAMGFHFMVNTALMAVSKDPEVEVVWASVAAFVLAALLVLLFGRFTPRRGVDEAE
jgi:drug/metabolite transporter (DMT)-like permease